MRRSSRVALAALSCAVALGSPAFAPVSAQDIGGVFDMGLMTGTAAMDPVIEQSREMAIRKGQGDPLPGRGGSRSLTAGLGNAFTANAGAGGTRRTPAPITPADAAKLVYQPSAAVRKANFARFVEKSRAVDPDGAARLETLFRNTDVMGMAQGWMRPYGMTSTNVADAAAVYLTTAWLATRGSSEDPDPTRMRAVRRQVASAMSATPEFATATDAQKQELAEAMIVQALLVTQFVEAAKAQPQLMDAVKGAVAQGASSTFGFDLRSMELSEEGLH